MNLLLHRNLIVIVEMVALFIKSNKLRFGMLNRITKAEGLPDGSGKPGEGLGAGFVPDLQRTAGSEAEQKEER